MFDLGGMQEKEELKELKYTYKIMPEYSEKELLSMEKEMLGIYISGHPLEKLREQIALQTNINTYQMRQTQNEDMQDDETYGKAISDIQDGKQVTYAGIITSVKKKYTKTNKIMAFVTVEDLYGPTEIIVFENCYQNCSNILMVDNIVLVDGRLSVREDEETKIVAREIKEFGVQKKRILTFDITDLDDKTKEKLRGAIKFFTGEMNNIQLQIINGDRKDMAGGIYITDEILNQFKELIGNDRVKVEEV